MTSVCEATCVLSLLIKGGTTTNCYTTVCSKTLVARGVTAATLTTFLPTSVIQCPGEISDDEQSCNPDGTGCISCSTDDPSCYDPDNLNFEPEHKIRPGRHRRTLPVSAGRAVPAVGRGPNMCNLVTNQGLTTVTIPWFPQGWTVLNADLASAGVPVANPGVTSWIQGSRTNMLRWLSTSANPENCCKSIISITGQQFVAGIDPAAKPKQVGTRPSVDHPYERSWLQFFFEAIIDQNAKDLSDVEKYRVACSINCKDLHNFFFGTLRDRNGMGDLFNALPGGDSNFLYLAGMSEGLNSAAKVSLETDADKVDLLTDFRERFPIQRSSPANSRHS